MSTTSTHVRQNEDEPNINSEPTDDSELSGEVKIDAEARSINAAFRKIGQIGREGIVIARYIAGNIALIAICVTILIWKWLDSVKS